MILAAVTLITVILAPQAQSGNVAVVVGGLGGGNSIEVITRDKSCLNDASIPTVQNAPAGQLDGWVAEYVDNQMVLCGGQDSNVHRDCYSYTIGGHSWIHACSMMVDRRYSSSLVTSDGRMVILGGYNKNSGWLDSIEVKTSGECQFTLMEEWKMPKPLFHTCAVMISSNELMIMGGSTKGSAQTDGVYKLNLDTATWTALKPLPAPLQAAGCLWSSVDGVDGVMVTGGLNRLTHYKTTLFYNVQQDTWTKLADMRMPRMGHQMFLVQGVPTVVGGYSDHLLPDVEQFVNGSWVTPDFHLKFGRYQYGGAEIPDAEIRC